MRDSPYTELKIKSLTQTSKTLAEEFTHCHELFKGYEKTYKHNMEKRLEDPGFWFIDKGKFEKKVKENNHKLAFVVKRQKSLNTSINRGFFYVFGFLWPCKGASDVMIYPVSSVGRYRVQKVRTIFSHTEVFTALQFAFQDRLLYQILDRSTDVLAESQYNTKDRMKLLYKLKQLWHAKRGKEFETTEQDLEDELTNNWGKFVEYSNLSSQPDRVVDELLIKAIEKETEKAKELLMPVSRTLEY